MTDKKKQTPSPEKTNSEIIIHPPNVPALTPNADGAKVMNVPHQDISQLMPPVGGEQRQSLQGFDEDFVDIVDYIIRITHRIWEEKGIGLVYDYYSHNCPLHTSDGTIYGRDAVVAGTIQAIAAFPDRRLYGDEVIWTGNDTDGFYTSHLITHMGHNTGHTVYAPPTGRKVIYNAIANCLIKENRIVEEWLIRDELSLIRQLGLPPIETARQVAAREAARSVQLNVPGEVERVKGQTTPATLPPPPKTFDLEDFVRRSIHEIWNWRLLNKIDDYYVQNYRCNAASGRRLYGLGDFRAFILSMLAAFPDAVINVDHFCYLGNERDGYRTATRWTLLGTHTGPGIYGEPTGKRVYLMGTSHHLIQQGKFVQEWTLFDEFSLLKQLYAPDSANLSADPDLTF